MASVEAEQSRPAGDGAGPPAVPAGPAPHREGDPAPRRPWARLRPRPSAVVLALAVATGSWAVVASQAVLPYLSVNHDEAVYLLQADALAHGRLFPPAPTPSAAFTPWFGVESGGKFVLKYTPVHAATLALGKLVAGTERATLGLLAAAAVALTYLLAREVLGSRNQAALAALLLCLSPLFLVQAMTFLPYVSNLVLLLGFALALLTGTRRGSRRLLSVAGFALGVAFFARPYDALLFAAPMGAWWLLSGRREPRRWLAQLTWFGLGAALPLAATLGFNHLATGNPLKFAFWLVEPLDTVGFGPRRIIPGSPPLPYTPAAAWRAFTRYAEALAFWCAGGVVLIGLAVSGLRRLRWPAVPVAAVAVSVPIGYFFFWGPLNALPLSRHLGPFYYLPVLVPLSLLAARGLARLSRWSLPLGTVALAGVVASSAVVTTKALQQNIQYTGRMRELHRAFETTSLDRAVVFVPGGPYLLHPLAFTRNDAGFDGPTIWALDRGQENFDVLAAFPDRVPYAFRMPGWYTGARISQEAERLELQRLRAVRADALEWRVHAQNEAGLPVVSLEVTMGGRSSKDVFVLDASSSPGRTYGGALSLTTTGPRFTGPVLTHLREPALPAESENGMLTVALTAGNVDRSQLRVLRRLVVPYRVIAGQLEVLAPTGGSRWLAAPRPQHPGAVD